MQIKLCYKEYQAKMSLGAMKQFKDATGLDLWCTLMHFIEVYAETEKLTAVQRMRRLLEVCDFGTAAKLFHALIKAGGDSVGLDEIEDAMFRSGWLPNEVDNDLIEPWPLIMVVAAYAVDKSLRELAPKKPGTSEQPEKG